MKLREWWRKLRLRPLEGSDRPVDDVTALASGQSLFNSAASVAQGAPPNWVPSQQDERPRH
jgi:hypothetical protein